MSKYNFSYNSSTKKLVKNERVSIHKFDIVMSGLAIEDAEAAEIAKIKQRFKAKKLEEERKRKAEELRIKEKEQQEKEKAKKVQEEKVEASKQAHKSGTVTKNVRPKTAQKEPKHIPKADNSASGSSSSPSQSSDTSASSSEDEKIISDEETPPKKKAKKSKSRAENKKKAKKQKKKSTLRVKVSKRRRQEESDEDEESDRPKKKKKKVAAKNGNKRRKEESTDDEEKKFRAQFGGGPRRYKKNGETSKPAKKDKNEKKSQQTAYYCDPDSDEVKSGVTQLAQYSTMMGHKKGEIVRNKTEWENVTTEDEGDYGSLTVSTTLITQSQPESFILLSCRTCIHKRTTRWTVLCGTFAAGGFIRSRFRSWSCPRCPTFLPPACPIILQMY